MKNLFLSFILILSINSFGQEKLATTSGHIKFISSTPVEDIEANNYKVTSVVNLETGVLVFSVPMQSFEFPIAKMQKHYNSKKFLNTKKFPKGKFKGTISNLAAIDFSKDGTYDAIVVGNLSIHGISNKVSEKLTITIKEGAVTAMTVFDITLADYGISFTKGKPSKNIGKTVQITAHLNYNK